MKSIACLISLLFMASAYAGRTDDLCTLSKADVHGFRCKVIHYDDGSESTLLLKRYIKDSDTEELKAKARLLIDQIVETHFRERGGSVKMRFVGKDGAWYERSCVRIKNTYKPSCYQAERVKDQDNQ